MIDALLKLNYLKISKTLWNAFKKNSQIQKRRPSRQSSQVQKGQFIHVTRGSEVDYFNQYQFLLVICAGSDGSVLGSV